jgi:hypothetical protein
VQGGSCSLINCTIANNFSNGGLDGNGGNSGQGAAGGVFNYSGAVLLVNTIIAGNNAANSRPDVNGAFISSGFNLIGNNQGATNLSILDFQNVSANLGPLQDNGGSTLTCVPLPGSYAIANGISADAPTIDQRGVPRPQGGAFDIGAVQVVTGSPFVTGAAMVSGSGFSLNTIFDATNKYRIQASTNLTAWIDLITNSSGGTLYFYGHRRNKLESSFLPHGNTLKGSQALTQCFRVWCRRRLFRDKARANFYFPSLSVSEFFIVWHGSRWHRL